MKTKIDSLEDLIKVLYKAVKFYRLHEKKYFFIDKMHLKKKSIFELENLIKLEQLFFDHIH